MQFLLPVISMASTLGVDTAKHLHTCDSDSFIFMYLRNTHSEYRKKLTFPSASSTAKSNGSLVIQYLHNLKLYLIPEKLTCKHQH